MDPFEGYNTLFNDVTGEWWLTNEVEYYRVVKVPVEEVPSTVTGGLDINDLPPEIDQIFAMNLPIEDILSLCSTAKRYRYLCKDEIFIIEYIKRHIFEDRPSTRLDKFLKFIYLHKGGELSSFYRIIDKYMGTIIGFIDTKRKITRKGLVKYIAAITNSYNDLYNYETSTNNYKLIDDLIYPLSSREWFMFKDTKVIQFVPEDIRNIPSEELKGETILTYMIRNKKIWNGFGLGEYDMVNLIRRCRLNNSPNESGDTPLELARRRKMRGIVNYLIMIEQRSSDGSYSS